METSQILKKNFYFCLNQGSTKLFIIFFLKIKRNRDGLVIARKVYQSGISDIDDAGMDEYDCLEGKSTKLSKKQNLEF